MGTSEVLCVQCGETDAEPGMPVCLDCYLDDDECPVHGWSTQICGGDCDLYGRVRGGLPCGYW